MPTDAGMCLANLPRWGYDEARQSCIQFIYGGCGGNRNRFLTETDCTDRCGSQSMSDETADPESSDDVCKSITAAK